MLKHLEHPSWVSPTFLWVKDCVLICAIIKQHFSSFTKKYSTCYSLSCWSKVRSCFVPSQTQVFSQFYSTKIRLIIKFNFSLLNILLLRQYSLYCAYNDSFIECWNKQEQTSAEKGSYFPLPLTSPSTLSHLVPTNHSLCFSCFSLPATLHLL